MKKSLQVIATCNGVTTTFDYKEIALFALLVGNRLSYARAMSQYQDFEMLENTNKHINRFLDDIDEKTKKE